MNLLCSEGGISLGSTAKRLQAVQRSMPQAVRSSTSSPNTTDYFKLI
jgi:hypothetical protein